MLSLVGASIEAYAREHSTEEPAIYERLRRETEAHSNRSQMLVGPLEGRLLKLVARLTGARRAVEVGTYTGYSALSIAEGMPEDGRLVTCDVDPEMTAIARQFWDEAPWGDRIELRLGDAADTLETLEGPFDLAFIDADKEGYVTYWDLLVPRMRSGGVVIVDNVLWFGRVLEPKSDADRAVVAFNEHVRGDDRVEHVMLTVRDGITLAVLR